MRDALLGAVLDRHLALGQQPREIDEQLAGNDDGPFALDLRLERRAQRQLHVGRSERERARLAAESRIPERTCTVPRVETARETTPSFATSSSFETVIFIPAASSPARAPSPSRPPLVASISIVLL